LGYLSCLFHCGMPAENGQDYLDWCPEKCYRYSLCHDGQPDDIHSASTTREMPFDGLSKLSYIRSLNATVETEDPNELDFPMKGGLCCCNIV
jgi:hypothetical protein